MGSAPQKLGPTGGIAFAPAGSQQWDQDRLKWVWWLGSGTPQLGPIGGICLPETGSVSVGRNSRRRSNDNFLDTQRGISGRIRPDYEFTKTSIETRLRAMTTVNFSQLGGHYPRSEYVSDSILKFHIIKNVFFYLVDPQKGFLAARSAACFLKTV